MSRRLVTCSAVLLAAVCAAWSHPRAQTTEAEPAYVVRGRQTEVRQRALKTRVEQLHASLESALKAHATDLLPQLEPPPSPKPGYQVLPTLLPDAPATAAPKPQVVSFYWGWSDKRLGDLSVRVDALAGQLDAAEQADGQARHDQLAAVVKAYQTLVRDRRPVDADVDYNWFWQRDIVRRRAWYDGRTRLLDRVDAAQRANLPVPSDVLDELGRAYPPAWVRLEAVSPTETRLTVRMATDITDAAFIRAFTAAVERYWRVDEGGHRFRTRVDVQPIAPKELYCREATRGESCAPPAPGSSVNLAAHSAYFPPDRAVLTTGAATLHVAGGRTIALGPHGVTPRTLAHEFGHILSFDDGYVRGYRDVGDEGFRVLELVLDPANIMSAPGSGQVTAWHFRQLAEGDRVKRVMEGGLRALYSDSNAAQAVTLFEEVLTLRPTHYGASLQLARALDAAGREAEAEARWRMVLEAATAINDEATAASARTRLGLDDH